MVNLNIVKYLVEGKKRGFSINLLKSKLLEAGFKEEEVNDAINSLNKQEAPKPAMKPAPNFQQPTAKIEPPTSALPISEIKSEQTQVKEFYNKGSLGFFTKLEKTLSHPTDLFLKTSGEGIWPPLKFLMITMLLPFVIMLVFMLFLFSFITSYISSLGYAVSTGPVILSLFLVLFLFIIIPVSLFISAGITHLFVKLYSGSGEYKDTFGILVYSLTPTLIFAVIPFVNFAAFIWSFVIQIFGISIRHKISKGRAALALLTPAVAIGIIIGALFLALTL